jgi:hypothetical protein
VVVQSGLFIHYTVSNKIYIFQYTPHSQLIEKYPSRPTDRELSQLASNQTTANQG